MKIRILPSALKDLARSRRFYERHGEGLGKLSAADRQAGQKLEDAGVLIAKRWLEQFVPCEPKG